MLRALRRLTRSRSPVLMVKIARGRIVCPGGGIWTGSFATRRKDPINVPKPIARERLKPMNGSTSLLTLARCRARKSSQGKTAPLRIMAMAANTICKPGS